MIVEAPVELWLDGEKNMTFMCSPYDLEDLGIGHLVSRGIVGCLEDIEEVKANYETKQIFVKTLKKNTEQIYSVPQFIVSGTSSVYEFSENIYKIPKIDSQFSIRLDKIVETGRKLKEEAIIYKETGGIHGAIICNGDKTYLREDIGRHCAVDKAIGAGLREGVDLSQSMICTTGRISLDMILKTAAVGIPVVVSYKYPSDMGVSLANHYGISIVARILSDEMTVMGNEGRIIK